MGMPRAYSFSTTCQVIKSEPPMQYQLIKCPNVCPFSFLSPLVVLTCNKQIQENTGHMNPMDHACTAANFQPVKTKFSTSPMTILKCHPSSRGWRPLFANTDCGWQMVCQPSAQTFDVFLARLTAAASGYFFHSLTLLTRNLIYRSSLNAVAICVIFIPNTTAN
jgi:hypothetical protein